MERRKLFVSVISPSIGLACPCCKERNEYANKELADDQTFLKTIRVFQKTFGEAIIANTAIVAFRLQPISIGIAKRGEAFFYLKPNLFPACCLSCAKEYEEMWKHHPDRIKFIEELVIFQQRTGGLKMKIVGGKIR